MTSRLRKREDGTAAEGRPESPRPGDTRPARRRTGVRSTARRPLLAAFSIYKMLAFALLSGTVFFPAGAGSVWPGSLPGSVPIPSTASLLALITIVFAAFAARARFIVPSRERTVGLGIAAALAGGLALMHVASALPAPMANPGLGMIALVAIAGGFCVLHVEIGRIMGYLGMGATLRYGMASSCIGCVLYGLLYGASQLLPRAAVLIVAIALIGTMATSLERAKDDLGRDAVFRTEPVQLYIPWRFIATSCIQGIAIGMAHMLFGMTEATLSTGFETLATFMACGLAFLTVIRLTIDYDRLIYRIGFLLAGVGLMLYAISPGSLGRLVAIIVQLTAFSYLDLVLWSFGAYLIKHLHQPAIWSTSCPTCALMGGRLVGTLVAGIMIGRGGSLGDAGSAVGLDGIAALMAFGIVAAALLLSSSGNIRSGWGFVRPGESGEQPSDRVLACQTLAEDRDLTARESEILQLLSTGMTRAAIAAELVVSTNTVKTHMRGIYGKLDIHTRAELDDLIATRQRSLDSREQQA